MKKVGTKGTRIAKTKTRFGFHRNSPRSTEDKVESVRGEETFHSSAHFHAHVQQRKGHIRLQHTRMQLSPMTRSLKEPVFLFEVHTIVQSLVIISTEFLKVTSSASATQAFRGT